MTVKLNAVDAFHQGYRSSLLERAGALHRGQRLLLRREIQGARRSDLLKRTAALARALVGAIGLALALRRGWTLVGSVVRGSEDRRLRRRELELGLGVQRSKRHFARRLRGYKKSTGWFCNAMSGNADPS